VCSAALLGQEHVLVSMLPAPGLNLGSLNMRRDVLVTTPQRLTYKTNRVLFRNLDQSSEGYTEFKISA